MTARAKAHEGWAILELMGHRRLGGKVTEALICGASFLRIDVPSEPPATQFYAPGSLYCITPTTEAIARAFATREAPAPVQRWELPQLAAPETEPAGAPDDDEDLERELDEFHRQELDDNEEDVGQ